MTIVYLNRVHDFSAHVRDATTYAASAVLYGGIDQRVNNLGDSLRNIADSMSLLQAVEIIIPVAVGVSAVLMMKLLRNVDLRRMRWRDERRKQYERRFGKSPDPDWYSGENPTLSKSREDKILVDIGRLEGFMIGYEAKAEDELMQKLRQENPRGKELEEILAKIVDLKRRRKKLGSERYSTVSE